MTIVKQDGILPVSFFADEDLTAKQYYAVYLTASVVDHVQLATGSSDPTPFGVLQNDSASACAVAEVKNLGFTKAWANAASAITSGDQLTVNSQGMFHEAPDDATTGGSGQQHCAVAIDALASGTGIIGIWFGGPITSCGNAVTT